LLQILIMINRVVTIISVVYLGNILDISPIFMGGRYFVGNVLRHIRHFQKLGTLSKYRDTFRIYRELKGNIGLRAKGAEKVRVKGFKGRGLLFSLIVLFLRCERAREV
jgi:hypothetical protein